MKPRPRLRRIASTIRTLRERHEERHRPSGFSFAQADRIDFLDAQRWDQTVADQCVWLTRDYLRVLEDHGPENLAPRYAMVFRNGQPAAVLAAQLVSVTGDRLQHPAASAIPPNAEPSLRGLLKKALKPTARAAVARVRQRLLVAGNLLSWGFHGIAFAPGENPATVWPGIAEALYRIRRAERLTGQTQLVLIKDLTPQQAGLNALHRFSYRPLETEPNMVLSLDPGWKSYDDYLAALDAKYRRNAKDQLKKLHQANCVIEPLTSVSSHTARLYELYLSVQQNATVRLVTLRDSYLPALAAALGDRFRCTVVRRDETILGFVTSLKDGDTAIAYYIGFDRAAAAEGLPIYLRLLHATIGDAIHWGCRRLSLGRTALEPKAALGAKPETMTVWMRHRIPAWNWLLRGILGSVTHDEAPERNPFKQTLPGKPD